MSPYSSYAPGVSRIVVWLAAWFVVLAAASSARGDRLVLRNLKIIADKEVTSFHDDGVELAGGGFVAWDEIERGTVAADKQAEFDQLLAEIGNPLYRLRQRMAVGDYEGLLPQAEALYPRYAGRSSATAYVVAQGLMWGRIAAGKREGALEPYFTCYAYLRGVDPKAVSLPGERRLRLDMDTGMTPELPPVWFDAAAARDAVPHVLRAIGSLPAPRPEGTRIYYASLVLAAGDAAEAGRFLDGFQTQNRSIAELRDIVLAEREVLSGKPAAAVDSVAARLESMSAANQPLARYWVGRARLLADAPETKRQGVLHLLHVPAVHGGSAPELSAAGLYESMNALSALGDARGSIAVRQELLERG
jgi:hypothetical protein